MGDPRRKPAVRADAGSRDRAQGALLHAARRLLAGGHPAADLGVGCSMLAHRFEEPALRVRRPRTPMNRLRAFLPLLVLIAIGVGAYAYYDTRQVARTAIALFADRPDA